MKIRATLVVALAVGMVIAPALLGAGAARAASDARIVFFVA
jgi:hypothetical protein